MFSGLIQRIGKFEGRTRDRIYVTVPLDRVKMGDSIAIDGVCLTVVEKKGRKGQTFGFDLSPETLERTNLAQRSKGDDVNVEPALRASDALGGHIVQGHIDGVGTVSKIKTAGDNKEIWFRSPEGFNQYLVPKGSVTVNGVSLTVVERSEKDFSVALIPFTLEHTTLGKLTVGSIVNLEADIIGKYVFRYVQNLK